MSLEAFTLTDRIALVTGAGRGIGEAIALAMAEAGAHVIVADRIVEGAQRVAKEIEKLGRKSLVVPTDVTVISQVENMVNKAVAKFGRIDIMVNNAGGGLTSLISPLTEMSEETWDTIHNLNLRATFVCCKTIAPVMFSQGKGNIINMSSLGGLVPYPGVAHYGAAKAGVHSLTQSLAAEFSPNIRVNAMAPGPIETPIVTEMYRKNPALKEERLKRLPLRRLGTPNEVAYTAVFLASDASGFITGQTIVISGGLTTYVELE